MGFGFAAGGGHVGAVDPVAFVGFGGTGAIHVEHDLGLAGVFAEHLHAITAGVSAVTEPIDLTVDEEHDEAEGEQDKERMNGNHGGWGLGVAGAVAAEDGEAGEGEEREQKDEGSEPGMLPGLLGKRSEALMESDDVHRGRRGWDGVRICGCGRPCR